MFTAFCSLLSTGCVRLPLKTPVRQPPELPQSLSAQLVHSQNEPQFVFAVFDENNRSLAYDIFQVGLESYVPHEGTNKVLTLECHIPRDAKNCPVIVLLPISAGSKYELERKFIAPYFAERGFAVILVFREDMRDVSDKAAIDILLRQSVLDEKRVLDWIETRSEFDSKRIASLGTSMGAIKNALLVATDSRIKAAVLVLGGQDLANILAYTKDGAVRAGLSHKPRGISSRVEQYLREYKMTRQEFEQGLAGIEWDPKNLAPYVAPEKVLLILGACDCIVPFRTGLALRKDMGGPETHVLVSGHYTSFLYITYIRSTALQFFERRFKE